MTGIGFKSGHVKGHIFLLLYFVAHQCSFDFCAFFPLVCRKDSAVLIDCDKQSGSINRNGLSNPWFVCVLCMFFSVVVSK